MAYLRLDNLQQRFGEHHVLRGIDLDVARQRLGSQYAVSGNIDPMVLFGPEKTIREEVRSVIMRGGGPGRHLLNLGHGVIQGTPEESVAYLVDEAKRFGVETNDSDLFVPKDAELVV